MIPLGVLGSAHVPASGGLSYRDEVLADSPFCYFPLDDGSTVTDVMGTVTPTAVTGVTLGAAGIGDGATSASFDGGATNRGIQLPDSALSTATSFTVEAIIKATNMTAQRAIFGRDQYFLLRHTNSAGYNVITGVPTWASTVGTSAEGSPTGIHHVALVWTGTSTIFYRDGTAVLTASQSSAGITANRDMYIGSRNTADTTFLGTMAGFAYYRNSALSAGRILAHAQAAGVA